MEIRRITDARDQHEEWLLGQSGVTGIGIGLDRGGNQCLKIYTNVLDTKTHDAIVARLRGIPLEFEEMGEVRAQLQSMLPTIKDWRSSATNL